jgi:DNA-binding transcriptional MerR regulator/methylmalonyl-CoA mutase cobalamin-binding subunit
VYTIKEAAARTGLSISVLRAWERRYGVVAPTRTAGGYRVYDEAALQRLRAMSRLIADGWSASAAAAAVVAGLDAASSPDDGTATSLADGSLVDQFVEAAATLESGQVENALDDMFASGSFERVVDAHVVPALRALGDAWERGRVHVAGEHLASNAIQRRLAAAFQASAAAGDTERPVLVGMPPGARHELGGLIFAIAARRAGLPVVYLGADLPLADWLAAVDRTNARAVVIGAVLAEDESATRAIGRELRSLYPGLVIAYGGPAAPPADDATSTIRLPGNVRDSVATLREALRTAAAR